MLSHSSTLYFTHPKQANRITIAYFARAVTTIHHLLVGMVQYCCSDGRGIPLDN